MKNLRIHAAWWQDRHRPGWAPALQHVTTVHDIVEAHTPYAEARRRAEVAGTLALVRAMQRRGLSLRQALLECRANCPANPRRMHDVRRWLARLAYGRDWARERAGSR